VVVDPRGDLLVAVGNGEHGVGDSYDYSDPVLRLGADATLRDSFSPTSWASDNASDLDLGSQGPASSARDGSSSPASPAPSRPIR
jgi:hypothetical protein